MKALLDASAILNIVRELGSDSLSYIRGCYELTLTPYEIGNAIWKEATLLKRLSIDEALALLNRIRFVHRYLNAVEPKSIELVLRTAHVLRITYYDASYVVVAKELNVPLVTDDSRLRKKVESSDDVVKRLLGREVKTLSSHEYIASKKEG